MLKNIYNDNMTNLKFIKNISDEGEATMLLYAEIGGDCGISGEMFALEMDYLQNNAKSITLRINSNGGSVLDGYSIISSIERSTLQVTGYIDGAACSIAGIIALCCDKLHMNDYGTLMLHNPSGADEKVLEHIKETLVTILKNHTSLGKKEIDDILEQETWLNAKECMNMGLIDSIIKTGRKPKTKGVTNALELMNLYTGELLNATSTEVKSPTSTETSTSTEAYTSGNITVTGGAGETTKQLIVTSSPDDLFESTKSINKPVKTGKNATKIIKSMKLIANKLELDELTINEEMVVKSIEDKEAKFNEELTKIKNELTLLAEEKKALEDKLTKHAEDEATAKTLEITNFINSYFAKGKIKLEEKEAITNLATIDLASVKSMLDKVGNATAVEILNLNTEVSLDVPKNREDWNYKKWMNEDSKGLSRLENENPGYFAILKAEFLKK